MNERNKVRRTALVLSGGGSRGAYQCGVWQALSELGIKIDIVVGVSVGAINGAMVVQGDVIKTANPVSYTHLDVYKRQSITPVSVRNKK